MERRKKRIVKLTAFLFLLAASIFVMPQKAFADENEDVTLPTGDIKPMEPQQDESGIDTYGADESARSRWRKRRIRSSHRASKADTFRAV